MNDANQQIPADPGVSPLNKEILGLVRHRSDVHYALATILRSCAPECIPAENTLHLINQIDNVIAGYRAAPYVRDIFVVTASDLEMEFTKSWVCGAFGTEVEALDYLTREARPEYNLTVSKVRLGAGPSVEEREAEQDELDRIAGDAQRAARST